MVDKSEIRKVFEEWDKVNNSKKTIFGNRAATSVDRSGNAVGEDGDGVDAALDAMTDFLDEDKPGGKKSKNPKKKVGKATTVAPKIDAKSEPKKAAVKSTKSK
jgi:hypothetical protein